MKNSIAGYLFLLSQQIGAAKNLPRYIGAGIAVFGTPGSQSLIVIFLSRSTIFWFPAAIEIHPRMQMITSFQSPSSARYFGRTMFRLLSLIIALSVGCDLSTSNSSMAQLEQIAAELKQSGPSPAIADQLKTYLENYPQDDRAWTILGNCQTDLADLPAAANAFDTALGINPQRVEAITGHGILLRRQGQYDQSVAMYQRALEVDPNYAQAYSSMVAIEIIRKDYAKAVQYGQQSYRLDNTDPEIAANLAIAYHFLNDVANRDKFKQIAAQLDFRSMDSLQQIFDGEIEVGQ